MLLMRRRVDIDLQSQFSVNGRLGARFAVLDVEPNTVANDPKSSVLKHYMYGNESQSFGVQRR